MELGLSSTLLAGDPRLIDHIVGEVKSQGIFDQFRKECIADVDTKPAYQNLRTRVEGSVNSFLSKQVWKPDLNKNQLRETLRKHIHDASYLDAGVERIVDQVVNPKVYSVFMPQIEDVVYKFLGIERPKAKEKNGACGLKDLLPKDLDPVSPESDKNSLKDESLESMDINDANNLDEKQDEKVDEQKPQEGEIYKDKNRADSENGYVSLEEKTSDEACKILSKDGSNSNLNTTAKSDDKVDEEEEEVSPTFEPIDIMNLNESNISNDSHLSGISELTSHRSRSPDFSNELSRDNFEYSNQDSQLSKVSSDSRLSIVTDFGSSNHALTPVHDSSRDETTKDKGEAFTKNSKDNFKAIREFDSSKNKSTKSSFDFAKGKDMQDYKDTKDFKGTKSVSSKENSRDATDSTIKDKYEHKNKEKNKDSESTKSSKSTKEKAASKETKYYKDKSNERKKSSSEKYDKHNSEKYDKHSKSKPKDKMDQIKESSDKIKDIPENLKDNSNKFKDEKPKEIDKKDNINKEVKDLKDIYKEKIRELREKKELTEKEKLNKDKDVKLIKETKDKKDPLKDKKSNKKEHKSSSSSSSSSKNPTSHHESKSSKTSEKIVDGKDKRSDSKDKAKRDEKRLLKESKGKSHYSSKSDLSDKSDKSDSKKTSKSEKEDKGGKVDVKKDVKASSEKATNGKKDVKSHLQQAKSSDRAEKSDGKKESKSDSPSKDKKRREDKKSKTKDDHSSLRKNSNDRRSTDRDGSNGSSNKTSPSSNSNSNVTSNKSNTSNLTKDNHVSNSGSETSDGIEETQVNDSKLSHCKLPHKISSQLLINEKSYSKMETDNSNEVYGGQEENTNPRDINLPLKKRSLSDKDGDSTPDVKLKKPKFAKNIHEAKKLMKIRKQMEKQKLKEDKKVEKKVVQEADQTSQSNTKNANNLEGVPDDERVQIIEIPDEEYEEPYPEKDEPPLMLDERSIIMPGTESCTNDLLKELYIRQSSNEIVSNVLLEETQATQDSKIDEKHDAQCVEGVEDLQVSKKRYKDDIEEDSKNKTPGRMIVDEENCLQTEETPISQKLEEAAAPEKSESVKHEGSSNVKQPTEKNTETRDYNQVKTQDDSEEVKNDNPWEIQDDNKELPDEKHTETYASFKADTIDSRTDCMENKSSSSAINEDNEDCRYFKTDNEKSERFSNFLESLELVENSSLEDIIESLGGKVVSSIPKSMAAPPLPKLRKRSSSPLSDILVNNSDNNNDGYKQKLSSLPNEDVVNVVKKRKYTKKPRFSNVCSSQGISNGENFVMPLSPDSDVSATSDKTASTNMIKEEKSRVRTSHQRYSSDDLYKPRPLFSSSSRRSRRSNNQA
ncbi:Biorientation of chromosomes in cell division protein 1-like protein [Trachymyrmex septentrionalis]|uniref:Biorientation of chromosomes in cell division protein 1-like protein n=1 Tax=Trachymyrmex septentrionalis TaxID=34720 RepID=A0A195EYB6_9HYME|nr:PREDICTED: biorientation of chromosomes in cell division protein 1-like 1 [Trachymyrmex septentrionalis]KYN33213.1 Biorientation of chromosomes in cell division protein 1-like protein [Trachymyrmex septentrionalis]